MKDQNDILEHRLASEVSFILNLQEEEEVPQLTRQSSTHTSTISIESIDGKLDNKNERLKNPPEEEYYEMYAKAIQLKDSG